MYTSFRPDDCVTLTCCRCLDLAGMGKIPVRLKEVTYTISPFEVSVLSGLFKDLPSKIHHKFQQVCYSRPTPYYCLSTFSPTACSYFMPGFHKHAEALTVTLLLYSTGWMWDFSLPCRHMPPSGECYDSSCSVGLLFLVAMLSSSCLATCAGLHPSRLAACPSIEALRSNRMELCSSISAENMWLRSQVCCRFQGEGEE